ncbi:NERD domain-containing protein [Sphingomonas sp. AAP5]|uniref:nuclease-related domain-containing DEAD/DEAH box helicase n=1 Tax=Sphingomonas sp. AAP5 TaxID=1523415 RepID=UPI001056F3C3|nr:nuclease-related domain-containing protein [Sphingomonas sp. AAP5]QBM74847.1 NERD domain-containing protein [Sphingomonas sp. AAP5]
MILITGVTEGGEHAAAKRLERRMLDLWPDLAQSQDDVVRIFVGLKMHGQKIEDLDLVVIGSFAETRPFDVEFKFYPREGEPFQPRSARVRNFALVIEVKSHDATGVRFENTIASVRYVRNGRETWENVTEKNRSQMFEFKRWLDRFGLDNVHVRNLVLFTGLRERDLPRRPHNCIASDTSFERLLNVLGQMASPRGEDRRVTLSYGSDEAFRRILASDSPLFSILEPTPLDRRRMDLIAKTALPDAWLEDLGERQILLKGRGGVGKTVILLQMAYRGYDQSGLRSLVLTFNKALVADMRRTMALLGVPRGVEKGGVAIETVHGFIGRLMMKLGVIDSYDCFLEDYEAHKETLLSYLSSGTVTQDDLASIMQVDATNFDWDLVFVDEGQDWPSDEIAILNALYGANRLVVSDGVDQYVRDAVADWSSGLPKGDFKARRLRKCLRMKANLAVFVADLALTLGLNDWDLDPNPEAAGGRVIVVEGDLAARPDWVASLVDEARALGNFPVDLLACVPPGRTVRTSDGPMNEAAAAFMENGGTVWDGTLRDVREHYPTNREDLRFVQYDSCRGLEGWTTVNYRLDELWEYKSRQWFAEGHETDPLVETREEAAARHAARWIMIPLTRAIDTLVINVGSDPSPFRDALREVAERRDDIVQWVRFAKPVTD